MKSIILLITHGAALLIGFVGGIYALPILIAPDSPSGSQVEQVAEQSMFTASFRRELPGSDRFHWGDGVLSISQNQIALQGKLAPGPDYRLYLSPEFVDDETSFNRVKDRMVQVGMVNTFENFIVPVPSEINPAAYTTAVVWCEAFGEFITSAQYR